MECKPCNFRGRPEPAPVSLKPNAPVNRPKHLLLLLTKVGKSPFLSKRHHHLRAHL